MNKRVSDGVCTALLALLLVASAPLVDAAAINYSAGGNGTLVGQAKCNKVGSLLVADAVAALTATEVAVTTHVHGKGPDHNTEQLHGKVGKIQVQGNNARGYTLFNRGPSLNNLPSTGNNPRVVLKDGSVVKGNVTDMSQESVTVNGQNISMSNVESIHSPYVYEFKVSLIGDSPTITFNSTSTSGGSQGTAHGGATTFWTVAIVGAIVATAIAVPIAVPLAVAANNRQKNNNRNNIQRQELINFLIARSGANQSSLPVPFRPPSFGTSSHSHSTSSRPGFRTRHHGTSSSNSHSHSSGFRTRHHGTSSLVNHAVSHQSLSAQLSPQSIRARAEELGNRFLSSRVVKATQRVATSRPVSKLSKHLSKTAPLMIKRR